jgi:type I restriction enzyme S subunit
MMERWELPKGWGWKQVSEIAEDTERKNPSTKPDESFLYVDIAAIDNKDYCIDLEGVKEIQGKDAPSRARKVIHANDVIFATTRPYLKNIAIVPQELDNQICSTGFCVLRAKPDRVIPKYLFFAVLTSSFINQLIPKGANYPAVNDSDIYQAIVPIPYPDDPARSLAEQRRIAARLETLLGEARALRAEVQSMRRDLAQVMESALAEVFPAPQQAAEGWGWKRLGDSQICEIIMGQSPPGNTYNDMGQGLPFFQGKSDFGNLYPTPRKWCTSPTKISLPGDVLISVRAPVGPTNLTAEKCIIGRGLAALRPSINIFTKYLLYSLRAFESYIASMGSGSTFSAISKSNLEQFSIPIPYPDDPAHSLDEQRRIVASLERIAEETRALDASLTQDLHDLNALEQSILAAAFRGEV